jgi:hypothetical protein
MDPSRRAQAPAPIPENRRVADIYRTITTAAFGTPVPLLIGQQRVPATIFRDGRTASQANQAVVPADERGKVLYGLCEGPVAAIPTMYGNKDGKTRPGFTPGVSAHVTLPLPYAAITAPSGTDSPEDASFEASSDINTSGNGLGTYQLSTLDGSAAAFHEDAVGLPALLASDFHVCTTGTGSTAVQWMVWFDRSSNSITISHRSVDGSWGGNTTICDGTTNSALRPASSAQVQPRIAAAGNRVHVVWSVLDNTGSAIQIAHVWSLDAGASWTAGQSLSRPSLGHTTGVWRLSLVLHSGGEAWVSFHRYSIWNEETRQIFPSKGVVVGYFPASGTNSTSWVIPTLSPHVDVPHSAGELYVLPWESGITLYDAGATIVRSRAPSVLPLGSGKALLAFVYSPRFYPGPQPCQLLVVPIVADTVVHWDLPAGAFNWWGETVPTNLTSIEWLQANGFPAQSLDHLNSFSFDNLNDGSTQIVATGSGAFGVLVLSQRAQWGSFVTTMMANHAMAGTWRMPWGSWNSTAISWTVGVSMAWHDDGFLAHAFYNGAGQVYIAMGKTDGDESHPDYRARSLALYLLNPGQSQALQVFTYSPSTELDDSILYQFYAQNGTLLTSVREDENLDGSFVVGIREVRQFDGFGDVLPSVIASRLLWNDLRGLNIKDVIFDIGTTGTWNQFDNYCRAMGIKFSLALTSQQAAWPLVCDILESANALTYMSEGKLKVYVRETAALTANGSTYTPMWNTGLVIPPEHLRDGIAIETEGIDASWNSLRVSWKNRSRAYADEPYQIDDSGSIARKGRIPGSAMDWAWICMPNVAATCTWLRMRHHQRTGRVYRFALDQRYMLLEVADIVAISMPPNYAQRWVRILTIEESDAGWREMTAEDAPIATSVVSPPAGGSGSTGSTIITPTPVNLPILFVALIGGILQVWALLSWPAPGRGCNVWQSWDGVNYSQVGSCVTPSPTGHLIQDMTRLRVQPGLRCRPGLRLAVADFAMGDYSESGQTPPFPTWGDWQAGSPGALLWVNGELMAYALESDDDRLASCSMLRRGLYDTEVGQHPVLARVGAVTDSAWTWPVPPGRAGSTCYFRFPGFGEDVAKVATYSVEIPA